MYKQTVVESDVVDLGDYYRNRESYHHCCFCLLSVRFFHTLTGPPQKSYSSTGRSHQNIVTDIFVELTVVTQINPQLRSFIRPLQSLKPGVNRHQVIYVVLLYTSIHLQHGCP